MTTPVVSASTRARHWSDILALFVGVTLIAISMWPSGITGSEDAAQEIASPTFVHLARILAGVLAICAVFVGQRWSRRSTARLMLGFAAVLLFAALVVFRDFGPRALLATVVPGVLLLVAALGVGVLPTTQPKAPPDVHLGR
jgi:peptidoglycan/LPS O-acetylase OafA/YrhL